jgi:hypothetical protein
MFETVVTCCPECREIFDLDEKASCPSCGMICNAAREFLVTSLAHYNILDEIQERRNFSYGTVKFRGEVECGIYFADIVNEFRALKDEPLVAPFANQLPKLDTVSMTLRHVSGEETILYLPPYVPPAYRMPAGRYVSVMDAVHNLLLEPVFPEAHSRSLSALCYFELVPAIGLQFARDRLWYAALAQGFYLFPDDMTPPIRYFGNSAG